MEEEKINIYRIAFFKGTELYNVTLKESAPRIPGFIAIETNVTKQGLPATKYINLSNIAEIVITDDVLERCDPRYIVPEGRVNVKINR
jgi:hypothetical protein